MNSNRKWTYFVENPFKFEFSRYFQTKKILAIEKTTPNFIYSKLVKFIKHTYDEIRSCFLFYLCFSSLGIPSKFKFKRILGKIRPFPVEIHVAIYGHSSEFCTSKMGR